MANGTGVRTPFFFEYPSVAAILLHDVRYGLQIGVKNVTIAPFQQAPVKPFNYTLGSLSGSSSSTTSSSSTSTSTSTSSTSTSSSSNNTGQVQAGLGVRLEYSQQRVRLRLPVATPSSTAMAVTHSKTFRVEGLVPLKEYSVASTAESNAETVRADAEGTITFEQKMVPPSCDLTIQQTA
jgi:hypothetical protein